MKRKYIMSSGYTLTEIIVVIAIIILLLLVALISYRGQINKGRDTLRKGDLKRMEKAFEDYYNDNGFYPPFAMLDDDSDCGSTALQPYLSEIPCDPDTNEIYLYIPLLPDGYRLLAKLSNGDDFDIIRIGCDPNSCGFTEGYNWGVSSGVMVPADDFIPNITPTPTDLPAPGNYACTPVQGGGCNTYDDPIAAGCPITWDDQDLCNAYCPSAAPEERCLE